MIKDCKELRVFKKRMIRETNNDFKKNLKIYEAMYKLSRKMLAGRKVDPLEGIDVKIRMAKVFNSV